MKLMNWSYWELMQTPYDQIDLIMAIVAAEGLANQRMGELDFSSDPSSVPSVTDSATNWDGYTDGYSEPVWREPTEAEKSLKVKNTKADFRQRYPWMFKRP